jgi:hypothetical protein
MDFLEKLTSPENLYWAWGKAHRYYRTTDAWYNEAEVAAFEADLDAQLDVIRRRFLKQRYQMAPLLPLPQPKKPDKEGNLQTRQAYWVRVRDQVAWLAYVNIVGAALERHMPVWSYGNRLYRPAWFEDEPDQGLRIGPYRNAPGFLYRKFQHSWPLYRRYIFLTVRKMSLWKYQREAQVSPAEQRVHDAEERLSQDKRLPYLTDDFWKRRGGTCYWAGFDLKKFYPSVNLACIKDNIREFYEDSKDASGQLLDHLLRFPLDLRAWDPDELKQIDLTPDQEFFEHIPTGLMVAGFLANVAMLKVDREISENVRASQVAHFRYVDDHVVLARRIKTIEQWIREYESLLGERRIGTVVHPEKFEPPEFGAYYLSADKDVVRSELRKLRQTADKTCALDSRFPVPLMTQTLGKVSDIARVDTNLLDDREQDSFLADLEHLLLTPFPETELPAPTRVSFAATRIARLSADRELSVEQLASVELERFYVARSLKQVCRQLEAAKRGSDHAKELRAGVRALQKRVRTFAEAAEKLRKDIRRAYGRERQRVFALLLKAVREYPEKLRLWERVLEFCRLTGHTRLSVLHEELRDRTKDNELAYRLLRAYLLRIYAGQVIKCARTAISDDQPPLRRAAALLYMSAVFEGAGDLQALPSAKYYERESLFLFRAAAGTCLVLLKGGLDNNSISEAALRGLRAMTKRLGAVDWTAAPDEWVQQTSHSLATWVWWAEQSAQSTTAIEPSIVWRATAPMLDPALRRSWSLWSLYPDKLPDPARRRIVRSARPAAMHNPEWLLAMVATASPKERSLAVSKRLAIVGRIVTERKEGYLDLRDWVQRVADLKSQSSFDPRAGEWTALDITRQVINLALSTESDFPVHWLTILVPSSWINVDASALTWERWHRATKGQVRLAASADWHQVAKFIRPVGSDVEFERVYKVGLILLGLLRLSFQWPPAWRSASVLATPERLTRTLIHEAGASSWCTAILEACLLPRQRETLLLTLWNPPKWDDDTVNHAPSIESLASLRRYIVKALEVIEKGQLTVRDQLPRQLIPVRIEQIARAEWGIEGTEIAEDEDQ